MAAAVPRRICQVSWLALGPFTVFDVETTGMSPRNDRIVEIAALRIDTDGTESRYSTLVNPGRHIPAQSAAVHHITDDMVADAPGFDQVGQEFLQFIRGSILVAHNARFDLGFLQESLARCDLPLWDGKTMDTIRLVKNTHPDLPSYRLQDLRHSLRLDCHPEGTAHRAFSDVEWTAQLLQVALTAAMKIAKKTDC